MQFKATMQYTIHNTQYTIHNICNIHSEDLGITDTEHYEYILTYSFPCTDLSVAGKGLARKDGLKKGGTTRSGLLWEVERILNECKELPQILLMENVPQVAKVEGFNDWCNFLKSKGYVNHYKILNAKDYGIPQNRERCFMLSFLSPDYVEYDFPKAQKLEKCVADMLETEVEEKYYINNEKAQKLICDLINKKVLPTHSRQTMLHSNKSMSTIQAYDRDCANNNGERLQRIRQSGRISNNRKDVIQNIEKYGNEKKCYKPFKNAVSYPLESMDFVRTGFQEICPTLSARDYKDPKVVIIKDKEK